MTGGSSSCGDQVADLRLQFPEWCSKVEGKTAGEIRRDGKGGKCTQKGFMAKPILLKSNPIIYSYLFLMHLDFPIESNSCQPVALVSDPRE